LMVKVVAATVPKETAVAPVKPVPVIVTDVPPPVDPELGETPATDGAAAAVKVYWPAHTAADVPLRVVTITNTVPAAYAGVVAAICVLEFTVKLAAATAPKETAPAPVKPVPVMITDVPPAVEPDVGLRLVTAGVAARL